MAFIGIVGAAKVGCRSSCTRSKSQADNWELPEQNLQHEVNLSFLSQGNMTNFHLSFIAKAWRPTQLLAGSRSNCQERAILLLFLASSWFSAFGKLKALKKSVLFTMLPNRLFFTTYFTHVQTCDNLRVQSATQPTTSGHTVHMSKPVIRFAFKVLRNSLLFTTYFTHVQTCENVRVQSATQPTTSGHTVHMATPVIRFVFKVLRNPLYYVTHFTHVQTCDNVRVQGATRPTTSGPTVHMATPVITSVFKVLRNGLLFGTYCTHVQTCGKNCVQTATQSIAFRIFSLHTSNMSKPFEKIRVQSATQPTVFRYILYTCPNCDMLHVQCATQSTVSRYIVYTCPDLW